MRDAQVTGQNLLARNVVASYLGHFVFIVLGFVMPRLIDTHVGQDGLGVWDLGWSLVSYLSLAMIGIGSSVNRFVAKFRSEKDSEALSKLVSTVLCIQLLIATAVLAASIALFYLIPKIMGDRLGDLADTAGYVAGLLGASLSVQMAFDAWRGVLSGCHRWDYYNAINAGGYALTALFMMIVLFLGGGLEGIAASYLVLTAVTEIVRYRVARIVCPEVKIAWRYLNIKDGKVAVKFGVKTILLAVPSVVVIQTVNLFIVSTLGPAVLAVLARPLSLISHVSTLVNKYSFILTPMAGSMSGEHKKGVISEFALQHARSGWIVTIPALVYLIVFGDKVLELWMGPDYANQTVVVLLAIGYLLPISQSPVLRILIGLDRHGRVAQTSLAASAMILPMGLMAAYVFGWSIEIGAGLIGISVFFSGGVNVLFHGFSVLGWSLRNYFQTVLADALWLFAALILSGYALRAFLEESNYAVVLACGALQTTLVFVLLQWRDIQTTLRAVLPEAK